MSALGYSHKLAGAEDPTKVFFILQMLHQDQVTTNCSPVHPWQVQGTIYYCHVDSFVACDYTLIIYALSKRAIDGTFLVCDNFFAVLINQKD